MRCPRCGNENPGTNRFCGMCGATLLPAPPNSTQQTSAQPAPGSPQPLQPAGAPPASAPRIANDPRLASTTSESEPVISGPSFLGLNQPANQGSSARSSSQTESRRASLSIDPRSASSSRGLDYLLEDDEPRSGSAGKFVLIFVALLLAVGLGYMRWKDQGLGWLSKGPQHKPSAATESTDSPDSGSSAPSPVANTNPTAPPSPATTTQPPAANSATSPSSSPSQPAATQPAPSQPAPSDAAPSAATAAGNAANTGPTTASSPPAETTNSAAPPADSQPDNSAKNPDAASADTAPEAKPKPAIPKPAPKPVDPVTEAQKYLYGKGARQDCDRGMRLLKPEADRSNPKAMIEMGALYSAGLCTPRDLPTAYRWFALALRKNPDNQALQGDLQKLWDEMTQPERQQAIRLSQ